MSEAMEIFKTAAENVVLFGGAIMGLFYGIRRVYKTARNVEKIVDFAEQSKVTQAAITAELSTHRETEKERDEKRDQKFGELSVALETLAGDLRAHVKMEEDRDLIRDQQLIQLTDHMDELVSEMRPNGGSSMKDILTKASQKVDEVHTRVAVLEQWKADQKLGARKVAKKVPKMTRYSKRK